MTNPQNITSPQQLIDAWEIFKSLCNSPDIPDTPNNKNKPHSVICTIEGFCSFLGLTRSAFNENFTDNPLFSDLVTRMKEESEIDARRKFELGIIPASLAPLWMARFGYSTKTDSSLSASLPVVISGEDFLYD